jgi:hypothetical protein
MLRIAVGVFMVLHGLVHLLYFGQSWRLFELQAGMVWPDGSWAFSKLLGDETTRLLASVSLILAAIGFVAGGTALFVRQAWWRPMVMGAAALSAIVFVLLWNGKMQRLDNQGAIGILINIAVLVAALLLQGPNFDF